MIVQVPLKTRLLLFLYGTKNLAGCLLALGGLALFFAGIIEDWWLQIVIGLYAAGWLLAPGSRRVEFDLINETSQESLLESLDALVSRTKKRLPNEAKALVGNIRQTLQAIVPRLFDGSLNLEERATITHSVTRDLPETISNYLRLPPAYANVHVIENGKTCKQLFLEQLGILDTQLKKMADSIYRNDADALIVNGRILGEKFRTVSFIG